MCAAARGRPAAVPYPRAIRRPRPPARRHVGDRAAPGRRAPRVRGRRRGGRARLPHRDRRPRLPRRGRGNVLPVIRDGRSSTSSPRSRRRLRAVSLGEPTAGQAIVYLPEGMSPRCDAVRAVDGAIEPAPRAAALAVLRRLDRRRLDRSGPAGAWPAVAGARLRARGREPRVRRLGARRDRVGRADRRLDADVISISHGTNCWTRIPFSARGRCARTRGRSSRSCAPGIPGRRSS